MWDVQILNCFKDSFYIKLTMEKPGKTLDANGNESSKAENDCHSDKSNTWNLVTYNILIIIYATLQVYATCHRQIEMTAALATHEVGN